MVAKDLSATGKDQSDCGPESGGRAGRNADGASLGCRSGVAAETGYHQPDRIMSFDGAASGTQRKTQTPFLFSEVFALCRSEDRIRAISIKNGLVCGRAEVLANDSR